MWYSISSFLIRAKFWILGIILSITLVMGFFASKVVLSYDFPQVVPLSDPDYTFYRQVQKDFGEDGNLIIIGFEGKDVFQLPVLKTWISFCDSLSKLEGVDSVTSIKSAVNLIKNQEVRKFQISRLFSKIPTNQTECDSLKKLFLSLPFYKDLLYNPITKASFLSLSLNQATLRSKGRAVVIQSIEEQTANFEKTLGVKAHISGLPYIRTKYGNKLKGEINFFLLLSVGITSLILLIFFRGLTNVLFPLFIIAIIMMWTVGLMGLLGYKITLLTALIPPLIVVMSMPNFIYFANSYHQSFKRDPNKIKSIHHMVEGIAFVVFMNNMTTSIGFATMAFLDSPILREFGIIAFAMIVFTYFLTTILMPIVFSMLSVPKARHIKYLDNKWMNSFLSIIEKLALRKTKIVFVAVTFIAIISLIGIFKVKALGFILDDVPKSDKLYTDLKFYENNFKGIMPMDVIIESKEPKGLTNLTNLQIISNIQDSLETIPEFANTLSVADAVKFARQAYYNGEPLAFRVPMPSEQLFMLPYLRGIKFNKGVSAALIDSSSSKARINARLSDCGSLRLKEIEKSMHNTLNFFTKGTGLNYTISGYSLIFLRGNKYLIDNLWISLALSIGAITIALGFLFKSLRLVIIVLIPNFLALAVTMGIMGYFNLYLKPSSVLVFSIAFGIAADASFHYIVKYRLAVKNLGGNKIEALKQTISETGFSLVYTTLILFFGFGIFCFSNFGSTIALGALTSITLFVALFTNIILIPALLSVMDKVKK